MQQNLDDVNLIFNEEETPEEKKKSQAVNAENLRIYESEIGTHAERSKHGEYGNEPDHPYEWDQLSWRDGWKDTKRSTGGFKKGQGD